MTELEFARDVDGCDERQLDELVGKNRGAGVAHARMNTFMETHAARMTGAVGKGMT